MSEISKETAAALATFKKMFRAVHEKHGGQAICRIPGESGLSAAVIIYVEGLTADDVADACEKVQAEMEARVTKSKEVKADAIRSQETAH